MVLWWMHLSAKLNVFLGVSNLNAEFLPDAPGSHPAVSDAEADEPAVPVLGDRLHDHAPYSCAAVRRGRDGPFPPPAIGFLVTMLTLAILEHWFLVLPLPAAAFWNALWQLEPRRSRALARTQDGSKPASRRPLPSQATIWGG